MEKQGKLTINSYLSIGLIVIIVTVSSGLSVKLAKIESELVAIRRDIIVLQEKINMRMSDRWTATMMAVYAREVKEKNPNIAVPDIQLIQQKFPAEEIK